jgi:hypothetical protein
MSKVTYHLWRISHAELRVSDSDVNFPQSDVKTNKYIKNVDNLNCMKYLNIYVKMSHRQVNCCVKSDTAMSHFACLPAELRFSCSNVIK